MPEECQGCRQRDTRIEQLEGMIKRMAESFDDYETRQSWEKTKAEVIEFGPNVFQKKDARA